VGATFDDLQVAQLPSACLSRETNSTFTSRVCDPGESTSRSSNNHGALVSRNSAVSSGKGSRTAEWCYLALRDDVPRSPSRYSSREAGSWEARRSSQAFRLACGLALRKYSQQLLNVAYVRCHGFQQFCSVSPKHKFAHRESIASYLFERNLRRH
jgi:hypothetical protein